MHFLVLIGYQIYTNMNFRALKIIKFGRKSQQITYLFIINKYETDNLDRITYLTHVTVTTLYSHQVLPCQGECMSIRVIIPQSQVDLSCSFSIEFPGSHHSLTFHGLCCENVQILPSFSCQTLVFCYTTSTCHC